MRKEKLDYIQKELTEDLLKLENYFDEKKSEDLGSRQFYAQMYLIFRAALKEEKLYKSRKKIIDYSFEDIIKYATTGKKILKQK